MKIAQIDVNYGLSSTGKIVHDLHLGLKDKGHYVQAFFGRGTVPKLESVYKISNDVSCNIIFNLIFNCFCYS
mgnify:CR=1 FL=1